MTTILTLLSLMLGILVFCSAVEHKFISKRSIDKRPFCNQFTGCRIRYSKRVDNAEDDDDSAYMELAERLVNEAKMWESLIDRLKLEKQRNLMDQGKAIDEFLITKRPFCNLHTGCSLQRRKRWTKSVLV